MISNLEKNNFKILLGFDFGTKKIGVAIGQAITKQARPLDTIFVRKDLNQQLQKIISYWKPDALIVGIPLNMDGTDQPLTFLARQFSEDLQKNFQLPVIEVDERLSTVEARARTFSQGGYRALKKAQIDSIAAQLILETWFARKS